MTGHMDQAGHLAAALDKLDEPPPIQVGPAARTGSDTGGPPALPVHAEIIEGLDGVTVTGARGSIDIAPAAAGDDGVWLKTNRSRVVVLTAAACRNLAAELTRRADLIDHNPFAPHQ